MCCAVIEGEGHVLGVGDHMLGVGSQLEIQPEIVPCSETAVVQGLPWMNKNSY